MGLIETDETASDAYRATLLLEHGWIDAQCSTSLSHPKTHTPYIITGKLYKSHYNKTI